MKARLTAIAAQGFAILSVVAPIAAMAASSVDQTFVAKVSQGGMFEVEASKVAEGSATAQDVKDFATAEVHDHTLVGDKLKATASHVGITFPAKLNPEFQSKLDKLKALNGRAFDDAYMTEMADIHAKDGAALRQGGRLQPRPRLSRLRRRDACDRAAPHRRRPRRAAAR